MGDCPEGRIFSECPAFTTTKFQSLEFLEAQIHERREKKTEQNEEYGVAPTDHRQNGINEHCRKIKAMLGV